MLKTDVSRSLELGQEALHLYADHEFELGIAFAFRTCGVAHYQRMDYQKALPELQKAKNSFLTYQRFKQASQCYYFLGSIYSRIGFYEKATFNYNLAIELAVKAKDSVSAVTARMGMGLIEELKGNHKAALKILHECLGVLLISGDKHSIVETLFNIGHNYLLDEVYEKSEEFLNKSLLLAEEIDDLKGVAQAYSGLGYLAFINGNNSEALSKMHEGLACALEIGERGIASETYKNLAQLYKKENDPVKALECYECYDRIRSKLLHNYNKNLIESLQGELDIEKSEREELEERTKDLEIAFDVIKEKNKDITDSLKYAKHIQQALLPDDKYISKHIEKYFIYYQPKEIVSGDFYWFNDKNGLSYLATVDCTGHGVPGAFISIVSCNCLYQAFKEKDYTDAGEMLTRVQELFNTTIRQKYEESTVKDGMDISLCIIDYVNSKVNFAGANHNMHIISKGEMSEVKGEKQSIGIFIGDEVKAFQSVNVQLQKGDEIVFFSDGYADQFGGESGSKKYFRKRLKKFLCNISTKPAEEQKSLLRQDFNQWKGLTEQVDDVLVIGLIF